MRRTLLIAYLALAAWTGLPAASAIAQITAGGGSRSRRRRAATRRRTTRPRPKRDEEWGAGATLDLPGKHNAGPCPYVKVLYDAARYQEFRDGKVASNAVGYTGEIQSLASGCEYTGVNPIHVEVEMLFALGRGPAAVGSSKDYTYWVAVTDRNNAVIDKQYFTVRGVFPAGRDRVLVTDRVNGIMIPRADADVSGSNFEVLVGFDVTPEMADFNRQGKRFRVNAGAVAQAQ